MEAGGQSVSKNSLQEFLDGIVYRLETEEIVEFEFSDFTTFMPSYAGQSEIDTDDLELLATAFRMNGLTSQPHVKKGFLLRGIGGPILLYKEQGGIDYDSGNYRYARLLVQVAVIIARIDGVIAQEEAERIVRIIKNLDFLSSRERIQLTAIARYFLKVSTGVEGSEQARDYLKVGLSKNLAFQKMETLSASARKTLIDILKDVITSDGIIQESEIGFLQDVYRLFDMPARSVRPELERYAQENHISLRDEEQHEMNTGAFGEVDDLLAGLIADFDDF